MNATYAALQRLRAEGQVIQQRSSLSTFDPQHAFKHLAATLREMREKATTLPTTRPKVEIKAILAKLTAAQHDLGVLDDRELRALCCTEETAIQPEFLTALERAPERLRSVGCVYGLVNAYFGAWRTMPDPHRMERLLCNRLNKNSGNNLILGKWRSNTDLFSKGAADFVALAISVEQRPVEEVLKHFVVSPLSKLGLAARAAAAQAACESFREIEKTRDEQWCLLFLKWMTESVLTDLVPQEVFARAISSLIVSHAAQRWERFQTALKSYVRWHKKLGDPRTREAAPNWRFMSAETNRRYLSWLARDSINFFFNTILPKTNENSRRKDFWLQYHDKIKDFQVAVSESDAWKIKASQHKSDLLYHSLIDHPTTSAFLMQFEGWGGDYIVIEFSESGNAAYLYKRAEFEGKRLSLRTARFASLNHLKFDKENRIFHSGDWEPRTRYRLSAEFGIKP